MAKLKFKSKYIMISILFFILLISVVLYQFGTHYYPVSTYDDQHRKIVRLNTKVNANNIRFKNPRIKKDIQNIILKKKVTNLKEMISLSLKITDKRLYYDTSTLLPRKRKNIRRPQDINEWLGQQGVDWLLQHVIDLFYKIVRKKTDPNKVRRQHDVDWLYKNRHANCIGYAYLFAATFNEIKKFTSHLDSCFIRIIYESPVHILFGCIKGKHTWNEIVFTENGKEMKIHVDANAADYYLSWNVTKFMSY